MIYVGCDEEGVRGCDLKKTSMTGFRSSRYRTPKEGEEDEEDEEEDDDIVEELLLLLRLLLLTP